jgi:hypothetical protein
MGRALRLVLRAPILSPILALAHATDRSPGGGGLTGTVLSVRLLGIVTGSVIHLVMLIATHLRTYRTRGRTCRGTADPATDVGIARGRCAVGGIGGDAIALIDVLLHLLAALALERHHCLRLDGRCCA